MNNNTIKYKNTNNDFVPQIPENWEFLKMRHIGNLYSGLAGKAGKDFQIETSKYRYVPFTSISNDIRVNLDKLAFVKMSEGEIQNQVNKDDILFLMSSETQEDIGKCAIVQEQIDNLFLNSFCKGFRISNEEVNANFLIYALNSLNYRNHFMIEGKGFTRINLKQFSIKNLAVALPPYDQQVAIANFLDKKCEQINQFIADKKQLINLLKEQRQSIVSNYVNSGCAENLSLKENPTIWLKESRSDWQFIKLKHLVELNKSSIDNAKKKNDLQKIALENIDNWTGKFLDGKKDAFEGQGVEFNKGDVLFNKLRPYLAKAIIAQNDGYCVGELLVLKPLQELITSEFLFFRLMTVEIIDYVNGSTYGAKMPRANWDFIGNIKIPLPSIDEQNLIVSKIKSETKTIDETIFKTEEELRLVAEYKEALISNAVTGQLHIA